MHTHKIKIITNNEPKLLEFAQHCRDTYFFTPYGIQDPYQWTFAHQEHIHIVFHNDDNHLGYAHIQLWSEQRAAIRIIVLQDNQRSKGLGSQFLLMIEQYLKAINIKSIHAESRQSSLGFYLKNGYQRMAFNDPEGHETDPSDIAVGKIVS